MKKYLSVLCPYCEKADINAYITSIIDERTNHLDEEESNAIDYDGMRDDIYDELVDDEVILPCVQCDRDNEGDYINDYRKDL